MLFAEAEILGQKIRIKGNDYEGLKPNLNSLFINVNKCQINENSMQMRMKS